MSGAATGGSPRGGGASKSRPAGTPDGTAQAGPTLAGSRGKPIPVSTVFEDPMWAEVYSGRVCDTGEIVTLEAARSFRDSIVQQNPTNASTKLSLRCLRIGSTALSCLALQLKDRNYTRVDLSDNQLGDHSVLSVRSLIRALPKMQWLGLSGNLICSEGIKELAEELGLNSSLESLVLGANEATQTGVRSGFRPNMLGIEGLKALCQALLRNPRASMTSLTLSNTSLSAEAGKHLATFLERNHTLLHLDVSSNPLSSDGVCALLPHCIRLRLLDVADTGCRGELIHSQLGLLLQKTARLCHLSLAHNCLETRPFRRIVRAVSLCESLVSLSLERTSLDTEAVTVMADMMLASPVQSLTELDLSDNNLAHSEAATALSHAMARSVLQVLRLNRNGFGDAGVRALADALDPRVCQSGSLQHLEMASCRIGVVGAAHLFISLEKNETLRSLRLVDNFLDATLDVGLIDKLSNLQELQLSGNRLSHSTLLRAAQVCQRNRRRARDAQPKALRAEVHRLLFEETKLSKAQDVLQQEETEAAADERDARMKEQELALFTQGKHDLQERLARDIDNESHQFRTEEKYLVDVKRELEAAVIHYDDQQHRLREKLRELEAKLVEVQRDEQQAELELDLLETKKIVERERTQELAPVVTTPKVAKAAPVPPKVTKTQPSRPLTPNKTPGKRAAKA
eukprot:TRINITY_DN20466_c1_g1_i1.p1 TRINITY_DN20466_c1_g1~~TRINITY_DN20466_c1_g1_i1.p1  ORF type:complete len:685 (-),score=144.55 TRINITY_DN20466_c1_g1_i1:135-2189(-)